MNCEEKFRVMCEKKEEKQRVKNVYTNHQT